MPVLHRLSVVIVALVVASSCGGGDDSASESESSTPTSTVAAEEQTTTTVESETAPEDSSAVVASTADAALTGDELDSFAAAIGTGATEALSTWLLASGIEQELADRGRPLTDADLEESAGLLGTSGAEPNPFLVRVNAVFTVGQTFGREEIAPRVADAEVPEVLCSSHILLDTEAEAADVAALAQGGQDFAELAMTYSTGPSGPNGGELGCTLTSTFVPEFGDGARANGVGVTDPVESQFGWHVIQVRSIGPGTIDNHPELSEEEAEAFRQQSGDEQLRIYLDELVAAASSRISNEATIDPAYGVWDEALAQLTGGSEAAG